MVRAREWKPKILNGKQLNATPKRVFYRVGRGGIAVWLDGSKKYPNKGKREIGRYSPDAGLKFFLDRAM